MMQTDELPPGVRAKRRARRAGWIAGAAMIGGWMLLSQKPSHPSPLVFAGQRGVLTADTVACPMLKELDQLGTDQTNHDDAGFDLHFRRSGCISVVSGDAGLDLDNSLWHGATKLRLDKDPSRTFWVFTGETLQLLVRER